MAKELSAKSHNEDIMGALNKQRRTNAKYCDITLVAEDKQFNAHRSILAASSVYFDTMFHSQMSEEFKEVIEIKSVSKQAMQDVVDFIYTNHVSLSIDNVEAVLHAASLMKIRDLIGITIEYLSEEISPLNCLHFRQLGKLYS
uniref:BTB domain-containing protein n=1 Tax=Ciona savignyi TaxID=51511 RepID=H2YUE0_CIOSA